MRVSLGLPVHRMDLGDEFLSADAVADLSLAAEGAGFHAVSVTDHPFPSDAWLKRGGHHAPDPFTVLAFAAAATSSLRVHTNLLVLPYRNPWLAAHQVATLDRMSGGRVILGVGTGYLEAEFAALGVEFEDRNNRTDDCIRILRRAWAGRSIDGNTMRPTPATAGGPPIWIGGNSRRAVRRAVELADGWSPFPVPSKATAVAVRTAPIRGVDELSPMIAYARDYSEVVGRRRPLDIVFMPRSLTLAGPQRWQAARVVEEVAALHDAGVTALNVVLPGDSRRQFADELARFGSEVLPELPA